MKRRLKTLVAAGVVILFAAVFVSGFSLPRRGVGRDALIVAEAPLSPSNRCNTIVFSNRCARALFIEGWLERTNDRISFMGWTLGPHAFHTVTVDEIADDVGSESGPFPIGIEVQEEITGIERYTLYAVRSCRDCYQKIREKRAGVFYVASCGPGRPFGHSTTFHAEIMNAGTNRIAEVHK